MRVTILVLEQCHLDTIGHVIIDMISKNKNSILVIDDLKFNHILPLGCVVKDDIFEAYRWDCPIFILTNDIQTIANGHVDNLYIFIDKYRDLRSYRKHEKLIGGYLVKTEIEKYWENQVVIHGIRVDVYSKNMYTNESDNTYLCMVESVLNEGKKKLGRNGYTLSKFGGYMKFDLSEGFPLLTIKSVFFRGVFEELMMFIRGQTNTKVLEDKKINIWKLNTSSEFLASQGLDYPEGEMGPMYGFNWRHFGGEYNYNQVPRPTRAMDYTSTHEYESVLVPTPTGKLEYELPTQETNKELMIEDRECIQTTTQGFDQLSKCLDEISNNPSSRRIIMTSFDPSVADKGVLYPCHGIVIQFHVDEDHNMEGKSKLNCMVHIRSSDLCCGLPFNMASYSLLIHMICEIKGNLTPGDLIITLGDYHVYESHVDNANVMMVREQHPPAKLSFKRRVTNIEDFNWDDVQLEYKNSGPLKFEMVA